MPLFRVSLSLWTAPPGDASLPAFVNGLRDQLVQLEQRWDSVIAPAAIGDTETQTCEVTVHVKADDISAAPMAAGRAVGFAADHVAPAWQVAIGRITVESPPRRPATLADLPPLP
ncbi:hypothetical protein [Micromonospora sp. RTP1Z1]|uniref:hypothetical protein n=1 Tax=Micromonospora sp. RTP1Z1 TaxID=2994043 RepID=UPI0029C62A30|nr:hypothetical protein [Micromonospora sp. RTP1Z1]